MTFRHIIFDCDGVLVDSEPLSMKIDQELLAENGIFLSMEDVIQRFIGLTFGALIDKVRLEFGVDLPAGISAEKDCRLFQRFERELAATRNASDALSAIATTKSVASNSSRERVAVSLRVTGLEQFFGDRITTFEDVAAGKPAPDIYLLAAERAGAAPGECLVVEDSLAGITSAVAAGCPVIGFTGLAHDRENAARMLKDNGARRVISSFRDLPATIAAAGSL